MFCLLIRFLCVQKTESLNSGDVFVLVTPKTTFVWEGKVCYSNTTIAMTNTNNAHNTKQGASALEKFDAGSIAFIVGGHREVVTFDEGKETDEFWGFLGGKGEYAQIRSDGTGLLVVLFFVLRLHMC